MQRRFERGDVAARSVAAHPGYTRTNLQKAGVQMEGGGLFHTVADYGMRVLNRVIAQDVDEGALPQVHAAVADVRGGTYWGPTGIGELRGGVGRARINPKARNEDKARRLWEISVATTGVDYAALASN